MKVACWLLALLAGFCWWAQWIQQPRIEEEYVSPIPDSRMALNWSGQGEFTDLYVTIDKEPGEGSSWTFTVEDLACTISDTDTMCSSEDI